MTRPLRFEFPNALYHVTSRGDRREDIYEDDDRERFLEILGVIVTDYNWLCHGYCLMSNHFHLIIETLDGTNQKVCVSSMECMLKRQTAGTKGVATCFKVDKRGS